MAAQRTAVGRASRPLRAKHGGRGSPGRTEDGTLSTHQLPGKRWPVRRARLLHACSRQSGQNLFVNRISNRDGSFTKGTEIPRKDNEKKKRILLNSIPTPVLLNNRWEKSKSQRSEVYLVVKFRPETNEQWLSESAQAGRVGYSRGQGRRAQLAGNPVLQPWGKSHSTLDSTDGPTFKFRGNIWER